MYYLRRLDKGASAEEESSDEKRFGIRSDDWHSFFSHSFGADEPTINKPVHWTESFVFFVVVVAES